MKIEQMSDRKLELESDLLAKWINESSFVEIVSGEVKDWRNRLVVIHTEIERREQQGEETR